MLIVYNVSFKSLDLKQELQAVANGISELLAAGKYDDMYDYYTDDCKVLPPGQEIIIGKEGNYEVLRLYKRTV